MSWLEGFSAQHGGRSRLWMCSLTALFRCVCWCTWILRRSWTTRPSLPPCPCVASPRSWSLLYGFPEALHGVPPCCLRACWALLHRVLHHKWSPHALPQALPLQLLPSDPGGPPPSGGNVGQPPGSAGCSGCGREEKVHGSDWQGRASLDASTHLHFSPSPHHASHQQPWQHSSVSRSTESHTPMEGSCDPVRPHQSCWTPSHSEQQHGGYG